MEETETTTRQRSTGEAGRVEGRMLGSSKPLHRFVQKEPRIFGVVLVIFGSTELLFANEGDSLEVYASSIQGGLFLSCGILSIYTDLHPSKKMVTVCLAMYVVSMLSIFVSFWTSFWNKIHAVMILLVHTEFSPDTWSHKHFLQAAALHCILLATSLFVFVLLIFLSTIARLALKSSRTQMIIHHVPAPQGDTTSD